MGQQVGTAIGFVAGFFLPGGPQVWAGIGGMVGGIIKPEIIPGPKIGEITQQTASEGGPRPIIFGRSQPIAGNIIVDSEPRIIKGDVGKGGPKQEAPETALRTYAVGVCRGPITAFLQVWRNGTLVYDIEDAGMEADNAEFLKYARFYLGSYDQMPSPDLEAVKGVGEVHGYRGTAYMVLADEDTTDQRGMWSQWQFRVARQVDVQEGQWWAGLFPDWTLPEQRIIRRAGNSLVFGPEEPRPEPNTNLGFGESGGMFAIRSAQGTVVVFGSSQIIEVYENVQEAIIDPPTLVTVAPTGTGNQILLRRIRRFGDVLVAVFAERDEFFVSSDGGLSWQAHPCPLPGFFIGEVARNEDLRWVCFSYSYPGEQFHYSDGNTPGVWYAASSPDGPSTDSASLIYPCDDRFIMVGSSGRLLSSANGNSWVISGSFFVPEALVGDYNGNTVVIVDSSGDESIIAFTYDAGSSWDQVTIDAQLGSMVYGSGNWVASGGGALPFKASDSDLTSWTPVDIEAAGSGTRWKVGYVTPAQSYKEGYYPLPQLIQELSEMVSMDTSMIDVSLLDGYQVRGLTITNTYPAYKVLESLSQFFFFMPSNVSGRVKFVPFGGDTVATITEDDLIYDPDTEIEEDTRRSDPIVIPPKLHLNYFDIQGGLNTDKQSSERPRNGRNYSEQSMQTPVSSAADEAATVVAKIHAMMVEQQRGEFHFSLPDNWLFLTESDPVFFQWQGRTERLVINQVDTQDGQQDYRLIRDRQSIHSLSVEGYPPAPVTRPPSRVIGPTLIEFLDMPILRDAHDMLGFYIAISGVFPAWRGAQVELSLDGGQNYIDGIQTGQSTTMGSLVTPLGDHPQAFPDEVNSCHVALSTPDASLLPTTLSGMMNRANLAMIGDEMVNFATVDETSEGLWELSYFLRGRKGTETMEHEVGERFVMLDNVFFVPAELTWLNKSLTFRATSLGTSTDEATVITVTFTGQSQTERQPAYLQAHRDGTDVVASWQGVGRLGGGVNVAMGAHFAGYRVTLTDGTVTQTHDTASEALTTSLSAFTGPVTVRVQQRNNFTGLGPYIEVII